jgi:alpha-tubulin suppressor-like RCC1 family protein
VTEPRAVPGVAGAIAIAAGSAHTCARVAGAVVCWGGNDGGQLGRGNGGEFDASGNAAPMAGIADAVEVALGAHFTCVLSATGQPSCAGASFHGEIGDGTRNSRRTPVPVLGIADAVHVAAGVRHACAVRRTGEVLCWGSAWRAQLGDGQTRDRLAPVPVRGLSLDDG